MQRKRRRMDRKMRMERKKGSRERESVRLYDKLESKRSCSPLLSVTVVPETGDALWHHGSSNIIPHSQLDWMLGTDEFTGHTIGLNFKAHSNWVRINNGWNQLIWWHIEDQEPMGTNKQYLWSSGVNGFIYK